MWEEPYSETVTQNLVILNTWKPDFVEIEYCTYMGLLTFYGSDIKKIISFFETTCSIQESSEQVWFAVERNSYT